MPIENQKYKDTVFRMLYNNKEHLLELYNAINETNYTNPDDLIITTLKGNTFLNMKNDVSFMIDFELNLFEHQSTVCPNIPLRNLYYISSSYRNLVPITDTYKEGLVAIPAPRFFVFYNGLTTMPDKMIYKLSNMYAKTPNEVSLELLVTSYNVNAGHNTQLMEACKTLKGYSLFVAKVRKYKQEAVDYYNVTHSTPLSLLVNKKDVEKEIITSAVTKAIDECIADNILKDFFIANRQEVISMSFLEYTAEGHIKALQDESNKNGTKNGITIINNLYLWLYSNNRASDVEKAIADPEYLSDLLAEYNRIQQRNASI